MTRNYFQSSLLEKIGFCHLCMLKLLRIYSRIRGFYLLTFRKIRRKCHIFRILIDYLYLFCLNYMRRFITRLFGITASIKGWELSSWFLSYSIHPIFQNINFRRSFFLIIIKYIFHWIWLLIFRFERLII